MKRPDYAANRRRLEAAMRRDRNDRYSPSAPHRREAAERECVRLGIDPLGCEKDDAIIAALRPLADENGIFADSFKVSAALEDAGFSREDFRPLWLEREVIKLADSPAGCFGHAHFQLPPLAA